MFNLIQNYVNVNNWIPHNKIPIYPCIYYYNIFLIFYIFNCILILKIWRYKNKKLDQEELTNAIQSKSNLI